MYVISCDICTNSSVPLIINLQLLLSMGVYLLLLLLKNIQSSHDYINSIVQGLMASWKIILPDGQHDDWIHGALLDKSCQQG